MFGRSFPRWVALAIVAGLTTVTGQAVAQYTFIDPAGGNWSVAANWTGGVPVPSTTTSLTFNDGNYTATNDIGSTPFQLNSMTFNNAAANTITIAGATPNNGLNFVGTNPTITKGAGNVSITAPVTIGANLTTAGGAGTLTFTNSINDNGGGFNVIKTGTGPLVFAGTNGTTVSSFNALSVQAGAASITGGTLNLTQPDPGTRLPGLQIGNGSNQVASFTASGGSTVNVAENVFIGDGTSATNTSTGTLTVTGVGTTLSNTSGGNSGRFAVGNWGNGTLNVTAGAIVNAAFFLTNRESGTSATILVDGAGSQLNTVVTGPANAASGNLQLASNNSGAGGGTSTGTLTVSNGGAVSVGTILFVAQATGNTGIVTVTGAGSTLTTASNIQIGTGTSSTGTMTVSNGATVTANGGFFQASATNSNSTVTITGTGSSMTVVGNGQIGSGGGPPSGIGVFNVQNGATASFAAGLELGNDNAAGFGGSGTINVSGTGSTLNMAGQLIVGANPGSVGAINVTGGGTVNHTSGNAFLGASGLSGTNPAASGSITVSGVGSTYTQTGGGQLQIAGGGTPAGTATLTVRDGGLFTYNSTGGLVVVGNNPSANGFLNVTSGGTFDATGFPIIVGGNGTSSPVAIGTVNVAGGQLNASQISLGGGFSGTAGGNGVMNVTAGGLVNTPFMIVGGFDSTVTGNGTLNVNGGRVLVATELDLADGGAGALNISNGGVVSVGANGFGGATASFTGAVTLNGYQSVLQINGQVQLGGQGGTPGGTGSITANSGSQVSLGDTLLYAGGSLAVNTDTTGSFTVNDLRDGVAGTSVGTVSIGTNSTLTINNTTNGIFQFSGAISGTGNLTKTGGGNQILTGANSYTGTTNVNGGILGFTAAGNLGTGDITFNGGTLQWLNGTSPNTTDITAGPRVVTLNGGGGTFDTNFNTITLANPINGIGGLTVIGGGTLTLGGTNTYLGPTTISNGVLVVTADANLGSATGPLGGVNTVSSTPAGTLMFAGSTPITTTRLFNMNGGTIAVAAAQTVTFSGSVVTGAVLDGSGTFATDATAGAQFVASSSTPSVTIASNSANDQFVHFVNGGKLNVAGGLNTSTSLTPINFNGFNNQGGGSITIGANSRLNVSNFQTSGTLTLTPAATGGRTLITNVGTSPLFFNGGSRTFIGTPASINPTNNFVAGVDLHGQNAIVAGGLFVNNGFVADSSPAGTATVVADFGALVKGAGFFQNPVVTQNGGKFQAGNSPGTAQFGSFTFGPGGVDNYVFAIDDATGTAGPSPNSSGQVSGWGLVKAVGQTIGTMTTSGNFSWTANPQHKVAVSLDTLVNPTTVGVDVPGAMADFDPNQSYTWQAAQWSGSYSGPTSVAALDASTAFDTSGFANPVAGSFGWYFNSSDHSLSLTYTPSPVPEPGTLALVGAAAAAGLWRRRKVSRQANRG